MGVRDASEPRSKEHADFKANPSKRDKRERGVISRTIYWNSSTYRGPLGLGNDIQMCFCYEAFAELFSLTWAANKEQSSPRKKATT